MKAAALGGVEVVLDAFAKLLGVCELALPLQVASEECLAVEGSAGQAFEPLDRVELFVQGADVREPVGNEQLLTVLLVDFAPGAIGAGLGVDD